MASQPSATKRATNIFISLLIVAMVLALFFAYRHGGELHHLRGPQLNVGLRHLPYYAICSLARMTSAYALALIFSLVYGLLAARGKAWERVMLPAIDVAQSVPVIGFFPAAIYFFVALAHGSRFGVEMAAVFLIFTSQAWNMALGVFESIRTLPTDSLEALDAFGATGWLRLKRLLLPACVPKLVYNSILSWVSGWYYLIACEIIAVGPAHYGPGVYAHGTDASGPLPAKGKDLLKEMERLGIILDVTHLCDECFWDALDCYNGPLWASHQNCRTLAPWNRQFADDQIKAVVERGGILGMAFDAIMMVPGWTHLKSKPSDFQLKLERICEHIDHICQIAGNAKHVGIGTDLDGGYGTEQTAMDMDSIADLQKIPDLLRARGYSQADIEGIMAQNFIGFLRRVWG